MKLHLLFLILFLPVISAGTIGIDGNLHIFNELKINDYLFPSTYGDTNYCLASNGAGQLFWFDTNSGGGGTSYWELGTAIGSIKYISGLANSWVGIGKDPTVALDVEGSGKISDDLTVSKDTTTDDLIVNSKSAFNRSLVTSVALAVSPYVSNGGGGLRLYDYVNSKYAEIRLGVSGSDRFLNFFVDGENSLYIYPATNLIESTAYALSTDRYYVSGADYSQKNGVNTPNVGFGYLETSCRRGELSISVTGYHTYLINTDGSDCDVNISLATDTLNNKIAIKNMDSTYNLNIASDNGTTHEYIDGYDYTSRLRLTPSESVLIHSVRWNGTNQWVILGDR